MTNIDRFESAFNAASRTPFQYRPLQLDSVLVVTDLNESEMIVFANGIKDWLSHCTNSNTQWQTFTSNQSREIGSLLSEIESLSPSLICTHRHLHEPEHWRHGLSNHVMALTQRTISPVLLLPTAVSPTNPLQTVMAMTDHLAGDHRLVNVAVQFTPEQGRLWLSDVEDEITFERYMDVIAKIPDLNTDIAREAILAQLFEDAEHYAHSCIEALREHHPKLEVQSDIILGHHLRDYKSLVDQHQVDLLVMNTKDEDQLAMHGLAYPLAVELVDVPILML
jgi:hypothetical protein